MLNNVAVVALDRIEAFELGVVCEVFGLDRSDDGLPVYDFAVVAGEPPPLRAHNGFGNATALRHHFRAWRGTTPHAYRRMFSTAGTAAATTPDGLIGR